MRSFGSRAELGPSLFFAGSLPPDSIDLSKATKLKAARFSCVELRVEWIATALRTITPKHQTLRRIFIDIPPGYGVGASIRQTLGETNYEQWLDLDRLLIQLWESNLIRPEVRYSCVLQDEKEVIDGVSDLLPEVTKKGIVNLAEYTG